MKTFDLVITGSGFAGSLLAMIARRQGHSVALIERGKHPRFAIGESSTPLANLLLEELAARYDLPRIASFSNWGTWQSAYPHLPCGLKRGFTFLHHQFDKPWTEDAERRSELLVAASPHDTIADTHWYRADFDHFFVREAQDFGAEYFDETALERISWDGEHARIEGTRHGRPLSLRARFVIDASGPKGFLHRTLGLQPVDFDHLPATQALYSHFTGVRHCAGTLHHAKDAPYPIDDAALHHVFEGGWLWVLRFNNGITSAGVAATGQLADEFNFAEGLPAWNRLLERLLGVREQFAAAVAVLPFVHAPRLSFQSSQIAGSCWALLPSAAGFLDPLLSTGFPLTLLGVARLAGALEEDWSSPRFTERLESYAAQTREELLTAERLVAALYANMSNFPAFAALSLLYFAAASFSETARRLGRPELAGAFLLSDHPKFGPELRGLCLAALKGIGPAESPAFIDRVQRAIEPIDVAGHGDRRRRNWYPVNASDLIAAGTKFHAAPGEIEALLMRSGFY